MDSSAGGSNEDEPAGDSPNEHHSEPVLKEMENVLTNFREMWQNELRATVKPNKPDPVDQNKQDEDYEQQANIWYLRGAEMERQGKFYEAIQWYKRAVQLVPDIDFKVHQKYLSSFGRKESSDNDSDMEENHVDDDHEESSDNEDDLNGQALLAWIQKKMNRSQWLCMPKYPQRTTHLSSLPMEILLYIFKWVVSSELDFHSLEMCSMVSRGFYLCSRDQEIWKLACIRVWGVNCGNLTSVYPSWRDMFINRARLQYNGCYISKTTYMRHGENSFQDQFYRPWHIVSYYRYLRFFPDGLVFMLTTPDEPANCVGLLKNRSAKVATALTGHYRLKDDKVTIVVQNQDYGRPSNIYKRGRRRNEVMYESGEQSFHLELRIQNCKRFRHVRLDWTHYAIFTRYKNSSETQSTFDIVNNRFPPLWFSQVKSYTQESTNPLQ